MGFSHLGDKARLSLMVGGAVFLIVFVPVMVWQVRRYGRLSPARLAGLALVCLYAAALVIYTWMPTPGVGIAQWCLHHHEDANVRPFRFVGDIAHSAAGKSVRQILRDRVLLQVVLNVVLFLPFGTILRGYLHRGVAASAAWSLGVSAVIEIAQYTAFFGAYPCAFRVADVDDVLLNTLGGVLGALLAPVVLWWMPSAAQLGRTRLAARPVTVWRRWAGMALDAALVIGITGAFGVVTRVARAWMGLPRTPDGSPMPLDVAAGLLLSILVVLVGPAWRNRAASAGQRAVWLVPAWPATAEATPRPSAGRSPADDQAGLTGPAGGPASLAVGPRRGTPAGSRRSWSAGSRPQRIARSLAMALPLAVVVAATTLEWEGAGLVLAVVCAAVLAADAAAVPFTRSHRGLSGALTGAWMLDIRDPAAPPGTRRLSQADRAE